MLKNWLLSLVVAMCLAAPSWAQVEIDKKNRIGNFGPGYCAWCSIEMLGRHNGVKKIHNLAKNRSKESSVKVWDEQKREWIPQPLVMVSYGYNYQGPWVQERRNVGTDWGIYWKMQELGVKYRMQWTGNYGHAIIKYAMKNKLGCAFAVKRGCFGKNSSPHAMVLTSFDDKKVEYIDPNDPDNVYEATREWFDHWWSGWILVLEKE